MSLTSLSLTSLRRLTGTLLATCVGLVVLAVIANLVFKPPFNPSLIINLATALLSFAATPLFIVGLHDFKFGVRQAYLAMCAGIVLFGIAQLQLPVIILFNLKFLLRSGLIAVPYIFSGLLIFWGLRRFGQLLQVRSPWLSLRLAIGVAVVVASSAPLIPHVPSALPPLLFDVAVGLGIWCGVFLIFAVMTILTVLQAASERYYSAFHWLLGCFVVLAFAALHGTAINLFIPSGNWYFTSGLPYLPFLIGSLLCLRAGYAFARMDVRQIKADGSPIDVVIYTAGLASRLHDLDPALNRLRAMTASLEAGARLTPAQEAKLVQIYRDIEDYLTKREALHDYDRASLREAVRLRFETATTKPSPFWSLFLSTD